MAIRVGPITLGRELAPQALPADDRLLREAQGFNETLLFMQERLAELELELEDRGWEQLSGEINGEFTRASLKRICALSRVMYLKNPLINRAVDLISAYVFGQGVTVQSADESTNAAIQAFWDDPYNRAELTSHQSRMLKDVDLTVLGNVFFVMFTQPATGQVKVRSIPMDEITEIISNPEDAKDVWYYHRTWQQKALNANGTFDPAQVKQAYYPDYRYDGTEGGKLEAIGGHPVMWDSPVYHLKTGGMSDMKFGVPETYSSLDWARAYKEFLEDWATISRALSRFAWNMTAPNGSRGVQAAKTKLNTLLGRGSPAGRFGLDSNPPPIAGSTFIGSEGHNLEPMKIGGANIGAEDGRRLLLMVSAGMGFPETFFGDVSVGTLATAKSLDRPTELRMINRRTLWADCFKEILNYALKKKVTDGFTSADTPQLDVDWPPLLEHDVGETVDAVIAAATLDGKRLAGTLDIETTTRLLLVALGVDDVDELLKEHPPEETPAPAPSPMNPSQAPGPGPVPPQEI